jgi:hypothetical protein
MTVTSSIMVIKAFKNPTPSFDCGKNLVMLSSMPSLDMATIIAAADMAAVVSPMCSDEVTLTARSQNK